MTIENRNDLARILKQRRVMKELTLHKLGDKSAVSASHLGRGVDKTPDRSDHGCRELIVNLLLRRPAMGYQEIGGIVGCSRQRVYQVANRVRLTRNPKPRNYRSDVSVERVLELYHQGILIKDIAKVLSCTNVTVRRRLRTTGISKSECYSRSMKLDWRGDPKIRAVAGKS